MNDPGANARIAALSADAGGRDLDVGEVSGPMHRLRGESPAMREFRQRVAKVAPTDTTVLLVGESGSGKELTAQTIHRLSPRRAKPFIPVNCGAIPSELIEAELFGHEKGSFTGALEQRSGYFEHASGGTILLDEITEMPMAMQVKLLRVLENGAFFRVGGSQQIVVDVRVIAATNRDPDAAVRDGVFRDDLMYRLAVFPLAVPPLRERREDIPLLAQRFLDEFNEQEGTAKQLSRRSLEVLQGQAWPGNVRELRNVLYRAFILADRSIDISGASLQSGAPRPARYGDLLQLSAGTSLADAHREVILATLDQFGGDKPRVARALGISLKTLYNRLASYGETSRLRPARPQAAAPATASAAGA